MWKLGLLVAVAAVLGFALRVVIRSYVLEARDFFPNRAAPAAPPLPSGLPGLENAAFKTSQGVVLHGWYVPSRNRAAIILLHGTGGDRTGLLPEATHLASRGFGVLLFDWPGHGESEGTIQWGESEEHALVAAVDFLTQRSDLDKQRLGALGFSIGGAMLTLTAADEPRLRALVLAGTPSNQVAQVKWAWRRWGPLSQMPALWSLRRRGMPLDAAQPVERVGAIAPRPVLIVSGTADQEVPTVFARELFAAAHYPKELLIVEDAGHGGYDRPPGSTYLNRVTAFFEQALVSGR